MFKLQGKKARLDSVAFSLDGRRLAAINDAGLIHVWDLASRSVAFTVLPERGTYGDNVAFYLAPADELMALRGTSLDLFHDAGWVVDHLSRPGPWLGWNSHAAAARAPHLVTGDRQSGRLDRYTLPGFNRDWQVVLLALEEMTALACSPDGSTVAVGLASGKVAVLDGVTGSLGAELGRGGRLPKVRSLALSPDGRAVAWCAATHLRLWHLRPEEEVAHHRLGKTRFLAAAFHPSGEFFATASGDGTIDTWDARTGEHREAFDWGVGTLYGVAFDESGDRAACCGRGGQVVVWDVDR